MSAQSIKNNYNEAFPHSDGSELQPPKEVISNFKFNSLGPRRRALALVQINIYEKKNKLFPLKRDLYLEKIKELILYEKNKGWKE